ncbi:hypothetical protein J8L70_10280 [Pseudoalteromonas sp. MMG010]|uniref:hypothetical protein n=1 Tax=Pseudoalteromonas sp. MMG010 TaxID=2822685 RepID=UPI001B39CEE7|nr:hypothetical protein [Pseudoalteromonas sp. MMG010]MBQ4833627.1 hypothetical protein [Pseudoalteromonas sp. MMG010]
MIKWIFIFLGFISAFSYADDAYTQSQCDHIKKQRESIRSQFRQGYSNKKGERLRARDKQLFKELAKHCNRPQKNSKAPPSYSNRTLSNTSNANWLLNQKVSNSSLYSNSYKNEAKLAAWSRFYKLPKRCRQKNMETANFVWCSEYRGKQKKLFEAQWQGRP